MPQLETERLILRPPVPTDADDIAAGANDYEVAKGTLTMPFPYERQHAEQFIAHVEEIWASGGESVFAIVLRAEQKVIGMCGIHPEPTHQHAEMGYWIAQPYWNQGYTTEAARALVDYGFRTLNLHRVYARHFHTNPASGKVMQKIGMIYEGTMRQHVLRFEVWHDLLLYGLLRSEWEVQGK